MSFPMLWSLRASVVILLGLGLSLLLRRHSAATQSLVLRITLAASCLAPLATLIAPHIEIPMPSPVRHETPSRIGKPIQTPMPVIKGADAAQSDPHDIGTAEWVQQTPLSTGSVPLVNGVLFLWMGGVGVLVLRWVVAFGRLQRLARQGEDAGAAGLKSGVQGRTEVRAPRVLLTDVSVPMTFGRTILLPLETKDWPDARVRAAILHERAHVVRHDWAWQTLAGAFRALHWPNPLAWAISRLLRECAEAAADDEAIRDMRPSDYARELLAVAFRARSVPASLAMVRRGGITDRVAAVLAVGRDRRAPSNGVGLLLLATFAGTGIALAGLTVDRPKATVLRALTDASGRQWDATGHPLVSDRTSAPGNPFPISPAYRWVKLEFDLGDSVATHSLDIEVEPPVRMNGYGPVDTAEGPVWLSILAPKTLQTTNVRVGLADGEWRRVPNSERLPYSFKRVVDTSGPQYILDVKLPMGYQHDAIRIVALQQNGTEPARIGSGRGAGFVSLQLRGRPGDLRQFFLQHRPYRWTTFQGVALRPHTATSPRSSASTALWDRDRTWQTGESQGPLAMGSNSPTSQSRRSGANLTVRIERAPRAVGASKWTLYVRVDGRLLALDRPYRLIGYDAKGVPQLTRDVPMAQGKAWISTNARFEHPESIVHWTLLSTGKDASRWESRP